MCGECIQKNKVWELNIEGSLSESLCLEFSYNDKHLWYSLIPESNYIHFYENRKITEKTLYLVSKGEQHWKIPVCDTVSAPSRGET